MTMVRNISYSNDHEPIHVHGKYQGTENKEEIIIDNGRITEIPYSSVKGKKPLSNRQMEDFKEVADYYAEEIIRPLSKVNFYPIKSREQFPLLQEVYSKMDNYFLLHKPVSPKKITKKIR
ncbi:MAG: DUF4160 domain-containing protein [Desulfococcaceae bacterium]